MNHPFEANWQLVAAARCQLCASPGALVIDPSGGATCQACLRRIDADPLRKRQILFQTAAFA